MLRLVALDDAAFIFQLVNHSRQALGQFLPWVKNMRTAEDEVAFIKFALEMGEAGLQKTFVIEEQEQIVGMMDLHAISQADYHARIGYWLDERFIGQGIVTKNLQELEQAAAQMGLHRLEILTRPLNLKSQAVAKRNGYHYEGLLKDYFFEDGKFEDYQLYAKILK